ncbi:hypothetical protein LHYA1_G000144 [Lachnellula hyalina]|uniref:Uncharacterized protein n=1 Tax=Lachnellula hyalina TaxID=1316788 RepID=A0A8H8R9P8_9HELO|nr:uncharacterized protein LHYA1_G000144 [Lachnellula hyalina]TVY31142.1 hypothetical protein LHYA1_G000144 [Lachnellula hyalina]
MYLSQYLLAFALSLGTVSAVEGLGKRAAVFERQQTCVITGWVPECPGPLPCAPPGAVCCADSTFDVPGGTCKGSTVVKTVGGGSISAPPSTITSPPSTATQMETFTYFTYEITWYYWYYYFTYIAGASVTASSQIRTITTVSVHATNSVAADALFTSLRNTITLLTPTQTTTSFSGTVPSSTSPAPTTYPAPSNPPTPSSNGTTTAVNTSAVQFTGAGVGLRAGPVASWAKLALGAAFVVPGLLMIWL